MKFYYPDTFNIPLPEKHRFPGDKYGKLREALIREKLLKSEWLFESPLATPEEIGLVHNKEYIQDFFNGTLKSQKMKRIGFPWSHFLVKRTQATIGGAIASARSALDNGISGQLAGGTHHAHYDYGMGYCIFNDFAVASIKLLAEGLVDRVAILDLDVHQGDGNASLLRNNPNVFVASLHGEKNFPFRKYESDLDVPLPDHCNDEQYLQALSETLPRLAAFHPDIVLYQAGVDGLKTDKLGRLDLSFEGLKKRDEMVFSYFHRLGIPISMGIGGGYSNPIDDSVEAYVNTYRAAKEVYKF